MRKKTVFSPYLILGLTLFAWLNVPESLADRLRSFTVASLSPTWKLAQGEKQYLSDRPELLWKRKRKGDAGEILRLQLENQMLRAQIERAAQWIESEEHIREQVDLFNRIATEKEKALNEEKRAFFQKKARHLRDLLQGELMAMPAQAIYRDPASWSSSLWINVGEEDNQILGRGVIRKNSPVVSGAALVGVIDYVGKSHSRVRLITDSGLAPSVQAVRGAAQDQEAAALVAKLISYLQRREDGKNLVSDLQTLKGNLKASEEQWLAKGELHGSSSPLWRARSLLLKGVGFHSDSLNQKGPSLKEGDLLVTTGLDGVFPPGLFVGQVMRVGALKPGGYAFELEARPVAFQLNNLQSLFVLPPLND